MTPRYRLDYLLPIKQKCSFYGNHQNRYGKSSLLREYEKKSGRQMSGCPQILEFHLQQSINVQSTLPCNLPLFSVPLFKVLHGLFSFLLLFLFFAFSTNIPPIYELSRAHDSSPLNDPKGPRDQQCSPMPSRSEEMLEFKWALSKIRIFPFTSSLQPRGCCLKNYRSI